jgi:hypothetical protein
MSEPGILEKSKEEYLNLRQDTADEYGNIVGQFDLGASQLGS